MREIAKRNIRHHGRCISRPICPAGNQSRYIIFNFIDGNGSSGADCLHRFRFGKTTGNLDITIHRHIRHDTARRHILHFGRDAICRIIDACRCDSRKSFTRLLARTDAHARRLLRAAIRRRICNRRHLLKRHAIHCSSRRLENIISGHAAGKRRTEFCRFPFFSFFDECRRATIGRNVARILCRDGHRRRISHARHRNAGHFGNRRRLYVIPRNSARRRNIDRRIGFLLRIGLFITLRIGIAVGILGDLRIRFGRCRRIFYGCFLFFAFATYGNFRKLDCFFTAVAALFRFFVTDFKSCAARAVLAFRILLFIRLRFVAARHTGYRAVLNRTRIRRCDCECGTRKRPGRRILRAGQIFDFRFGKDIIRDDADGSADRRALGYICQPRFIYNRRCIFGGNGNRALRRSLARPFHGCLKACAAVHQDARIGLAAHVSDHTRHADIACLRASQRGNRRRRRIFRGNGNIAGRNFRAACHFRLTVHIAILDGDRAADAHFIARRRRIQFFFFLLFSVLAFFLFFFNSFFPGLHDILAGHARFDSHRAARRDFRIFPDVDIRIARDLFNADRTRCTERNDRLSFIADIGGDKGLRHHRRFLLIVFCIRRLIDNIRRQIHRAACLDDFMLRLGTRKDDGRIVFHILHGNGSRYHRFRIRIRIEERIHRINRRFHKLRIRFDRRVARGNNLSFFTDVDRRRIFEIADHDGCADIDILIPSGLLLFFFLFLFFFGRLFLRLFRRAVTLHLGLLFRIGLGRTFFRFYRIGITGSCGRFFIRIFIGSQNTALLFL